MIVIVFPASDKETPVPASNVTAVDPLVFDWINDVVPLPAPTVNDSSFVESESLEDKDYYLQKIISETNPITEFIFLQSSDYEMNVKIYEFLDSDQPYLLVNEEDNSLNVFINVGHKFFQNIVQFDTSEQQLTYKLNCVFDAVSETSVMKRKGKIDREKYFQDIKKKKKKKNRREETNSPENSSIVKTPS